MFGVDSAELERKHDTIEKFHLKENKWELVHFQGEKKPGPLSLFSACFMNEKLVIFGGDDFLGNLNTKIWELDINTLEWTEVIIDTEIQYLYGSAYCDDEKKCKCPQPKFFVYIFK